MQVVLRLPRVVLWGAAVVGCCPYWAIVLVLIGRRAMQRPQALLYCRLPGLTLLPLLLYLCAC